jgi:hypothetical protein
MDTSWGSLAGLIDYSFFTGFKLPNIFFFGSSEGEAGAGFSAGGAFFNAPKGFFLGSSVDDGSSGLGVSAALATGFGELTEALTSAGFVGGVAGAVSGSKDNG